MNLYDLRNIAEAHVWQIVFDNQHNIDWKIKQIQYAKREWEKICGRDQTSDSSNLHVLPARDEPGDDKTLV